MCSSYITSWSWISKQALTGMKKPVYSFLSWLPMFMAYEQTIKQNCGLNNVLNEIDGRSMGMNLIKCGEFFSLPFPRVLNFKDYICPGE